MEEQKKKRNYKSPESRARQLAALSGVKVQDFVPGVEIQKTNGQGAFASVPDDLRRQIIDMYCQGMSVRAIEARTGISKSTINDIKTYAIDESSHMRDQLFNVSIKQKLQKIVDASVDRVDELIPEMSAKDVVLAMGVAVDKLAAMEKNKGPESFHQHLHVHTIADVDSAMATAMKPKQDTIEHE
jgi:hypothetical protein